MRNAQRIQITISPDDLSAVSDEEFRAATEKLVASVEVAIRESLYRSVAERRPIMTPVADPSLMEYGPVEYGSALMLGKRLQRGFGRLWKGRRAA